MSIVVLDEGFPQNKLVLLKQSWVIVDFLEELLMRVELIVDLLLLPLQLSSIFEDSFVVVYFSEAWVLPHSS